MYSEEWVDVLLLTDTVEQLVVAVGHDHVHTDQVVDGAETTSREVTLYHSEAVSELSIVRSVIDTERTLY